MYCNKPLSSLTTTVTDTHSVDYNRYLGVGCTSTLVSQSKEERKSKIHITVINGFGLSTRYDIVLDNGLVGDEGSDEASDRASHTIDTRRDRMEEESITGAMIIWCIHHYLATTTLHTDDDDDNVTTFNEDDIGASLQQILNRKGDSIEITKKHTIQSNHGSNTIDAANYVVTQDNHDGDNSDSTNGRVAMLTPNYHSMKVEPILQIVIPSHPIIFPGSFNPVHIGHIALANAAIQTMSQKMKDEFMDYCSAMNAAAAAAAKSKDNSGIDRDYVLQDIWNSTDYFSYANCLDDNQEAQQGNNNLQLCPILFELSLTNADKPPMDAHEVKRRVEMFSTMLNDQVTNVTKNNDEYKLPKDWGVLLTSAPLFIDKVRLLREHLIPSAATYHQHIGNGKRMRLMTFVIGTDTMVRIINPKYYGNSIKNMIVAVREMGDLGAHFVVGGRLEQSKDVNNGLIFFVSGESELAGLPEDVKEIFTIIKEEDFRVDISSSEIRNKGQTV
jgi:nicotinic acid mononucleotide adenylyltransferase